MTDREQPRITFDSDFIQRARTSFRTAIRGSDNLGDLLRVHLTTEQLLNETLDLAAPNSGQGSKKRSLTYYQKARLARSMGIVTADGLCFLLALNKMRNRFAHQLGYELTDDDVSSLARLAPNAGISDDEDLITRFSKCLCLLVGRLVGELQGFRFLSGEADVLVPRK